MERIWYDRPEFLDLRDEWYAKLKEAGFEDIETNLTVTRQPGPLLKGSPSVGDLTRRLWRGDKEDYYRWARAHLHEMADGRSKSVWELHSEGESIPSIHHRLEDHYPGLTQGLVRKIIGWEEEKMRQKGETPVPEGDPDIRAIAQDIHPAGVDVVMRGSNRRDK